MSKKLVLLLFLLFISIVPTVSYFITQQLKSEAILNGRVVEPSRSLSSFNLQDTAGEPFTLDSLRGQWTVLSFGFTHCPDICPATLAYYRDEIRALADNRERTQFVFLSVDPDRDSLERLQEYIGVFEPRIKGVTGDEAELQRFVRMFGAYFAKEGSGPDYQVAHSPYLFLVNPRGEWQAFYSLPLERGMLAMDLSRLIF